MMFGFGYNRFGTQGVIIECFVEFFGSICFGSFDWNLSTTNRTWLLPQIKNWRWVWAHWIFIPTIYRLVRTRAWDTVSPSGFSLNWEIIIFSSSFLIWILESFVILLDFVIFTNSNFHRVSFRLHCRYLRNQWKDKAALQNQIIWLTLLTNRRSGLWCEGPFSSLSH